MKSRSIHPGRDVLFKREPFARIKDDKTLLLELPVHLNEARRPVRCFGKRKRRSVFGVSGLVHGEVLAKILSVSPPITFPALVIHYPRVGVTPDFLFLHFNYLIKFLASQDYPLWISK